MTGAFGYELLPDEVELWRGRQWAVTSNKVTCHTRADGGPCGYWIAKDRLTEEHPHYSWMEHLVGKGWVDLEDFIAAFCVALALHSPRKINRRQLIASIERAREKARKEEQEAAAFRRKEAVWRKERGREDHKFPRPLTVAELCQIDALPDPSTQG